MTHTALPKNSFSERFYILSVGLKYCMSLLSIGVALLGWSGYFYTGHNKDITYSSWHVVVTSINSKPESPVQVCMSNGFSYMMQLKPMPALVWTNSNCHRSDKAKIVFYPEYSFSIYPYTLWLYDLKCFDFDVCSSKINKSICQGELCLSI